jgi:hypothetical protein
MWLGGEMKTKKQPHLSDMFDGGANSLVFWSFRYFLGRRTIQTCAFANELSKAWPMLNEGTQSLIRKELDAEFDKDTKMRNEHGTLSIFPLGDTCDRAAWQRVKDAYAQLPDKTP